MPLRRKSLQQCKSLGNLRQVFSCIQAFTKTNKIPTMIWKTKGTATTESTSTSMEPPAGTSSTALKKIDNLGRDFSHTFCPPEELIWPPVSTSRLTRLKFQKKRNEDQLIHECCLSLQKNTMTKNMAQANSPIFSRFSHYLRNTIPLLPSLIISPKKRLNSGNLTRHHWIQRLNQCLSD